MRYQELIYIQNENEAVRNKDILNVNMSSDICIFQAPSFNVSGATKINCSGNTIAYISSTASTANLNFVFTGNTNSFTANTALFKYEIYKYNTNAGIFTQPAIYKSEDFYYSGFSGTNTVIQAIPLSGLSLDGDYLIKGYFKYNACTEFANQLGKTLDTLSYINGSDYGIYDSNLDFYFVAFKGADTPKLQNNGNNTSPANQLFQQIIFPVDGQTTIEITQVYAGQFILTLNGLVLAPTYDFTYTGSVVTLNSACVAGDVITVIYTTYGGNNLVGDNISVDRAVSSGTTNGEGTDTVYYNTTTNKYELFTSVTPVTGGAILVMLNGLVLANGADYYQSSTNPKRIILEGNVIIGDLFTIVYYPTTSTINELLTNNLSISWRIDTPPQLNNGVFTIQVSTGDTFTTTVYSNNQDYVIGKTDYYQNFTVSGTVGDILYYRVKNTKNYETLCENTISDIAYSETIPITIASNSINSY